MHQNLVDYVTKFSSNVRDIFLDKFLFTDQLKRLNGGGILVGCQHKWDRMLMERIG